MIRIVAVLLSMLALSACRQIFSGSRDMHGSRSASEVRESYKDDRKRESARFSDTDLQRMVDHLFVEPDPDRANFHGLLYAGSRPVPFLIKALDEPRTQTTVFFREGFHLYGNSPFERICDLLDAVAPPEAAKPLARYLDHPDSTFRRKAALVLGKIATAECLVPVKKALSDPDRQVRLYAMFGIMHGLEEGRRNEEFLPGVFSAVLPLLNDGVYDTWGPAEVLVAIDFAKAVPILEAPQYFSLDNPQFREVLTALNRKDVKVPHKILLPALAELERLSKSDKVRVSDYETALILYARNPDDAAESRFRSLLDSQSTTIASAGATGLEILANISPEEAVSWAYEQRGFAAMSRPQQYYHAITDYMYEVNNGGHWQYFRNSSGDVYKTALEGLRAIGATSKATILASTFNAFPLVGPSTDNSTRSGQMELLCDFQAPIFASKVFTNPKSVPANRSMCCWRSMPCNTEPISLRLPSLCR